MSTTINREIQISGKTSLASDVLIYRNKLYVSMLFYSQHTLLKSTFLESTASTPEAKGDSIVKEVEDCMKELGFPDDKGFLRRIAWVESKYGTDKNTYRSGYHGGIWQVLILYSLNSIQYGISSKQYHNVYFTSLV